MSRNYGNKFYAKCQNLILDLTRAYDAALEKYDVIVMPTLPYKPPKVPSKDASLAGRWYLNTLAGICCQSDAVITSMRRHHVLSMEVRRYYDIIFPWNLRCLL